MKNRFSKITLLVLSLAFVLGVAFALSAGAEENVKPEIIGKNISYTDKTAIQIAVDAATVNKDDVELVVTKADGTEITVTKPESKTINGKNALVFTLEGIPASAICENVTIVVKSGDNQCDPFTYSVAEYFYERLYSDGVINATEGKPLSQKELYERYLSYGAAAQDLFLNYDDNGNRVAEPVTLVDKYNVVAISKGVLDNGNEVMISPESFTTTVTANADLAADKTFTGKWTVTTYGETVTTETVENGATVTANGIIAVTPVYTDATGDFYLSENAGTRIDFDAENPSMPTVSIPNKNETAVAELSVADGALSLKKLQNGSGTESYIRYNYDVPTDDFSTPVYVFESDISFYATYTGGAFAQLELSNCGYTITVNMKLVSGEVKIYTGSEANGISVKINELKNIRFECDYSNNKLVYCVDNEVVKVADVTYSTSSSKRIILKHASSGYGGQKFTIDNIYLGIVEDGTPTN
ncbi:MAG: hypothetical protein J6D20_05860 [Clostridia bacterium]|nr:hypothetical protein [Clostridia bacterium]